MSQSMNESVNKCVILVQNYRYIIPVPNSTTSFIKDVLVASNNWLNYQSVSYFFQSITSWAIVVVVSFITDSLHCAVYQK